MTAKDNGTPPEPSGGEAVEVDMARVMGDRISMFAGRPIAAADMDRLLDIMVHEQAQLEEQMYPTAFDLKQRLTHPRWALELTSPNHPVAIGLMGHKLIQDVFSLPPESQADAALRAASLLALISDGMTARAVLKIFGFQYRFAQAKAGAESRIVMPT